MTVASLVDDASPRPDEPRTEEAQEDERSRLLRIIEDLVTWDNTPTDKPLASAAAGILRSYGGSRPLIREALCGGESIPLQARRLAPDAHGSDSDSVVVLVAQAGIQAPPKVAISGPSAGMTYGSSHDSRASPRACSATSVTSQARS